MERIKQAATEALRTHDALRAVSEWEPAVPEDVRGMPLGEAEAWTRWHEHQYRPAFTAWSAAMDDLADAMGDPGLSRHPFTFRPMCEKILTEKEA